MGNPRHRLTKISQKIICFIAISMAIQPSAIKSNVTIPNTPLSSTADEASLSAPGSLPNGETNYAARLPNLVPPDAPAATSLPSPTDGTKASLSAPGAAQRPSKPLPPNPGENHNSVTMPGQGPIPGKPYFDVRRIPGNIKVYPGSVHRFETYVTNVGTAARTGTFEDTLTNSYYIKIRNYQASTGTIFLSSRTGTLNGKVVPYLEWEGTILPGQTLLISYEIVVAPNAPRGISFKSLFYSVVDFSGSCTWGYYTVCQRIVKVELPPNIQVRRSPGNTTVIPGIAETHYIYFTNSSGVSWSGFIDEEFSGHEFMNIGNLRTTHGNVTHPHASYMRWSGTIGPKQTVTFSYQTTAKQDVVHGSVFKARFYTGLNDVANNCLRVISQCERTTTILIPSKS